MEQRGKLALMAIAGVAVIALGAISLQTGAVLFSAGVHLAPEWAVFLLGGSVFFFISYVFCVQGTLTLTKVFAKVLGKEVNK